MLALVLVGACASSNGHQIIRSDQISPTAHRRHESSPHHHPPAAYSTVRTSAYAKVLARIKKYHRVAIWMAKWRYGGRKAPGERSESQSKQKVRGQAPPCDFFFSRESPRLPAAARQAGRPGGDTGIRLAGRPSRQWPAPAGCAPPAGPAGLRRAVALHRSRAAVAIRGPCGHSDSIFFYRTLTIRF